MDTDSYEIGLENFDTETRRVSDLDQISFWNEEAKKLFQKEFKDLEINNTN